MGARAARQNIAWLDMKVTHKFNTSNYLRRAKTALSDFLTVAGQVTRESIASQPDHPVDTGHLRDSTLAQEVNEQLQTIRIVNQQEYAIFVEARTYFFSKGLGIARSKIYELKKKIKI